jgi:uncharacterized protein (DUF58 family)
MPEKTEPQIQLNTRLLPLLVLLLLVMQLINPYRGWVILLAGLGGAWLIGYLWARSLARGLKLTREMRFGWAQVGDKLQERFTVENQGWAPAVWVEIIDHSTLPDYRAGRVTGVGAQSENRWHSEGYCTRRGLFTLGPTGLRTSDPLGLYTVQLYYPACADLMVTPPILPLPSIEVAPGGRAEEGRRRPLAPERTVISAGVRDYQPGDSLRWIHWPTTARRDALYVRLFDNLPAGNWWIVLDMNGSVQVGEGGDSTAEHGIILSASLASQGLQAGRQVGLVASGAELVWCPLGSGENQQQGILRALALLEPGERSLENLLARMPPGFGRMSSLIIVTPDVEGSWVNSLVPLLRRGVVPTVLLLDPLSFGGTATAASLAPLLSRVGAAHGIVTRQLLDRPEARPGRQGRWEWHISATGRAVPIRRPADMAWKKLS